MASKEECKLEIQGHRALYSFPTSAQVMQVKQQIESDLNVSVLRQALYVQPPLLQARMEDNRTLASYGIRVGETAKLLLEIEPKRIRVMLHYVGYPPWLGGDFITCYETVSVGDFKMLILEKLHTMGLLEIAPDDMELRFGDLMLDQNPGATLSSCGVTSGGTITIQFLRNHPPAGTSL